MGTKELEEYFKEPTEEEKATADSTAVEEEEE